MLSIEAAPATVAELPLFDGGPYPASVRVVEPVVSLFINKRGHHQRLGSADSSIRPEVQLLTKDSGTGQEYIGSNDRFRR
jgi:hypothetical protein